MRNPLVTRIVDAYEKDAEARKESSAKADGEDAEQNQQSAESGQQSADTNEENATK